MSDYDQYDERKKKRRGRRSAPSSVAAIDIVQWTEEVQPTRIDAKRWGKKGGNVRDDSNFTENALSSLIGSRKRKQGGASSLLVRAKFLKGSMIALNQ